MIISELILSLNKLVLELSRIQCDHGDLPVGGAQGTSYRPVPGVVVSDGTLHLKICED